MNLATQTMLRPYLPHLLLAVVSLVPLTTLSSQAVAPTNTTLTAYKVQSGDTLRGVANKFGLTVAELAKYNNKTINDKLVIGEVLLLSGDDVAKVVSKIKPDALKYVSPKPTTTTATTITYSVKAGETINGIANRNNTTPSEILRLNNLTADSKLAIGQKLQLPVTTKPSTAIKSTENPPTHVVVKQAAVKKETASPATPKAETKARAVVKITEYSVISGDSLAKVAARYSIAISDLAKMNHLKTTDSLKIGQKILVPIAVLDTSNDKKY